MNFNEFVNEVKDNIRLFLPKDYENAEVSTMECQKLNRAYTGLMVRKEGEMLTPTINLNQLYEAYKAQPGVTMETVCRKIADIVIEAPIQVDLKSILNYEDVKDKLFIRVSSAEANKEVLENAPHHLKEDLAITYHVAVGKDQDGLSSMFIKNDLLEQYGISAEQLHEDAMKSSPREVHYDLTLPEALEAYEKIPSERMHGLKCVGFDLKDGSDYEGMQSLMIEGKIQKEFLNSIPGFRENSYVQNAISRVEKYLEERHPNVENPLESNKKVDNEKNISEEKNEKELNIQMKPIPKKKRGEMSL